MIVRLKNGVPCPYSTLENGKIYEVVRTAESTRMFDHLDQIRDDKLKEIGI